MGAGLTGSPALAEVGSAVSGAFIGLDFDGTLAAITPRPEQTRPDSRVHSVIAELQRAGATVAIITGRSVASLLEVSGLGSVPGLIVRGMHGAQHWQDGQLCQPEPPPGIALARAALPGLIASYDKVWIEDKVLSLVVHARLATDPAGVLSRLDGPLATLASGAGLVVQPGKDVLEFCLPGIDKGIALAELISDQTTAVLYAGDDVGDLPAFTETVAWGQRTGRPAVTIAVSGPISGHGDIEVPDHAGVILLLSQLAGRQFSASGPDQGSLPNQRHS